MTFYNCPNCPNPVQPLVTPTRSTNGACPNCGAVITYKRRAMTYNPYVGMNLAPPPAKRRKVTPVFVSPGRSLAAPVRTLWPGANLNPNVTHVSLLSAAWTGAGAGTLCMAYHDLVPGSGVTGGILIDCPQAVPQPGVIRHFAMVKNQLTHVRKLTDIAEATGEAAAALCILQKTSLSGGGTVLVLAGFEMCWGMHVHSGAGIDQIWKRGNQYLIVEAKAPNQILSLNKWMPPNFQQMGTRWIMHNLITMKKQGNQDAIDILTGIGATTGTRWPNYNNASKNYYGVTGVSGVETCELYGVTVTAVWQPDGMLHYSCSGFKRYTNFAY